jgi:hypothetical protein
MGKPGCQRRYDRCMGWAKIFVARWAGYAALTKHKPKPAFYDGGDLLSRHRCDQCVDRSLTGSIIVACIKAGCDRFYEDFLANVFGELSRQPSTSMYASLAFLGTNQKERTGILSSFTNVPTIVQLPRVFTNRNSFGRLGSITTINSSAVR